MKKFSINILNSKFTKLKTLISNIGISNFKGNNTTLNRIELVDYNKFSFEIAFLIKKVGQCKIKKLVLRQLSIICQKK